MEHCILCNKNLSDLETVTVKKKGVENIKKCSIRRNDGLDLMLDKEELVVHVSCRKAYINENMIKSYLKKKKLDSQEQSSEFDYNLKCIFCNQDAKEDNSNKELVRTIKMAQTKDTIEKYALKRGDSVSEMLLSSGREHELLSLHGSVLRRLERLTELPPAPPRLELRLAPTAPASHDATLVGRLLTQAADPDRCVVNTAGFQDLRVDCPHEAVLELRDNSGERIWCGGEQVAGYFRRSDSSARPQSARVADRGDGTYSLTVTPPSPGAYLLAVTLNNKPVKGSPFQCAARACQPHSGQFHCCSFCSSGGRRDAHCACPGHMPGYRGCGHGHTGHPGVRHWSCCGSTKRCGPCERASLYQFSL